MAVGTFYGVFMLLVWAVAGIAVIWLLVKTLMGVGWAVGATVRGIGHLIAHLFRFIKNMLVDLFGTAGGVFAAAIYLPTILVHIVFGRWQKANHYGRALESEVVRVVGGIYRLAIGHPARLLLLKGLTEGIESRVPDVIARAPDRHHDPLTFDGYKITGKLTPGGSGAKLFLAEPSREKLAQLASANRMTPRKVVIKSFSLAQGSTLPQIVRESRALEAAKKLGMVLDHDLNAQRFFYVMPYVPGDDLGVVGRKLHEKNGDEGLSTKGLQDVLGYAADLLETLDRFHGDGLWHKDIKPNNVIVSHGRAHLVDLGLITPLQSAMTLTTHGTEYFRDPEMVRQALKGVKVHDVDGVKFDIYGAGAVLYALVENSFPAHGSLSQISKRCPAAMRWIVRRAMADMDNRYASAREMLADLQAVSEAKDPFALKPADLPSVSVKPELAEVVSIEPRGGLAVAPWPTLQPQSVSSLHGRAANQKKRRGVRWGTLLAASFLGLALVGAAGSMFLAGATHSNGAALGAPSPIEPAADGWTSTISADLEPETVPATVFGQGRTILVLDDVPVARDPDLVAGIAASLRHNDFRVLGAGVRPIGDHIGEIAFDQEREVMLSAEARAAIGLGNPGDPDARHRLGRWLADKHPDELHAILWVGPDAQGAIHKNLVTRIPIDRVELLPILNQAHSKPVTSIKDRPL